MFQINANKLTSIKKNLKKNNKNNSIQKSSKLNMCSKYLLLFAILKKCQWSMGWQIFYTLHKNLSKYFLLCSNADFQA